MKILFLGLPLLFFGCATRPNPVFRNFDYQRTVLSARNAEETIHEAQNKIAQYPNNFFGYALMGDAFQYSQKFDSASFYYCKADSIFRKGTSNIDDFGRLQWLNDGSVLEFEDMLVRRIENEILLGRPSRVIEILDSFELDFFYKIKDGSALKFPENIVEFGVKRLIGKKLQHTAYSMDSTLHTLEDLSMENGSTIWRNNVDIKAYIELYELSGEKRLLDSAKSLIKRKGLENKSVKYLEARLAADLGEPDSVDNILKTDSSYYCLFLRSRLKSLTEGRGYYGRN